MLLAKIAFLFPMGLNFVTLLPDARCAVQQIPEKKNSKPEKNALSFIAK
ncbi:MAG TPA: hypothetical protein VIG66_08605 [Noviherbaspirillum sp.]